MSTHSRLTNLIAKGKGVFCTRTGTYYPYSETNSDGKGGRISKEHDVFVHDQTVQQSKYKKGVGWQRGFN